MRGVALDGIVGRLLERVDGPLDLPPALEVQGQLGRDVPRPGAIPVRQAGPHLTVQLGPPRRPQGRIQYLLVEGMVKAVPAPPRPIGPDGDPGVREEALLHQPVAHGVDGLHSVLRASRHRRRGKRRAHHTGDLEYLPCRGREEVNAPQQHLPHLLGQLRHAGLHPCTQRPLPRAPGQQPLLHQMLHEVHQEQGMAVGARVDARHEGRRHWPPQPPCQIRSYVRGGQQFQGQFAHQPVPSQLLHQAAQRVRVEHEVDGAIRPEHQQLRWVPPLRQVGQQVHRGPVTPLQVFEHQHQWGVGRQHIERLGEFAAHAGRGRPGHLALEPFQLRLAHQPRELYQPQGRIPPQHRQDRVARRPTAQLPQRLEEWQVRFPLAIMLDALPPPEPPRTPGRTVGQKPIDHRRLANADVAAHEDKLARAVGGALEPILQPRDVLLAPHDGTRRPWGRVRRRAPHVKAIPLLGHRLEILWRCRCVAQGRPNLLDTHPQDRVAHVRAAPDVLAQLGFRHQAVGMCDQIAQHRQRPRPQGNPRVAPP